MYQFDCILKGKQYTFHTKPGLFSHTKLDKGTELLINTMEVRYGDKVLDLGCGYGAVGIVAANEAKSGKAWMVDTDVRAIKYAKMNAEANGVGNVEIRASDGFEELEGLQFDVILSNPPNHSPKETFVEFFEGAKKHLKKDGKLFFVTENRLTPLVKRELLQIFGNFDKLNSNSEYIIGFSHN